MSKELKPIPENECTFESSSSSSASSSGSQTPRPRTISQSLLQSMTILNPILNFDLDPEVPSTSNTNISMEAGSPVDSIQMLSSRSLMDGDDGQQTPTPKCIERLNIEKIRSSLQLNRKRTVSTDRKTVSMLIQEQSPSFLVIESLVWIICSALEKDAYRKKQMFTALCESMASFNVLGLSYLEESLQPIRDSIAHKFNLEIQRVQHILNNGVAVNDNPTPFQSLTFDSDQIHLSTNNGVANSNRFLEEFEEIEIISRGGFGVIKKSRYKLDNCIYAVKEIDFPFRQHEKFLQIIREVKLYANLEPHPNVISYKTAWIQNWSLEDRRKSRASSFAQADIVEVTLSSNSDCSDETDESEDSRNTMETELNATHPSTSGDNDDDDLVSFRSSLSNEEEDKCDSLANSFSQLKTSDENSSQRTDSNDSELAVQPFQNTHQPKIGFRAVLYIQMELCGIDLRKYLDRRNRKIADQLSENGDPFSLIDVKLECDHFLQILKGVEYIHSKHMIHRDLKPQNILFSLDNSRIKIGDFGLATLHSSTNFKPSTSNNGFVGHTRSLGTEVYAAPEQRSSYNYDYRVDMYSLGLILFELFHPFFTNMERGILIDKLKSLQEISKDMTSRWPKLCALILKLTSKTPDDRPRTITDVISLFREAFPNILLLKPNLTRKEIESLIQENLNLKMILAEKEEQIEKLKQTIAKCSLCSGGAQ